MADQTLLDFFAGQKMVQVAQSAAIKRSTPRPLPEELWNPSMTKPSDDKVEYIQYSGNRAGARLVDRMSPALATNLPGSTRKYATAVNVKEMWPVSMQLLDALKSMYAPVANGARQEYVKRMADFNSRFEITRTNIVSSVFATGKIWVGSDGDVLPSSSGASLTIDFSIPTGNQLTTDGSGGTYTIGDWSTTTTDIGGKLRGLRDYNLRANNYQLQTVLYGTNVPTYLSKNTTLKEYFARFPEYRAVIAATNEIPNGALGYNWKPVHTAYQVSQSGTVTQWFGDNFVGVMPQVDTDWYEFVEGGNLVPKGLGGPAGMAITASIDAALNAFDVANGKYAYVEVQSMNGVNGISLISGDSFLPIIKVPGTYYYGVCA